MHAVLPMFALCERACVRPQSAGCGEPIVLVHGFGLSSFHYRRNIPELAKQYKVRRRTLCGPGRLRLPHGMLP
jgi:pimeloyl-ACP methyl ester carboxylesterase